MDTIDDEFTAIMQETKHKWHPSICAAVSLSKKTLNKYYSLTDNSENYQIAISECSVSSCMYSHSALIVLHPWMKLKYFKDRKWESEWIQHARTILTKCFHESYAGRFRFQKASDWESSSSRASSEI
jgi:hypothetical protein